MSGMYTEVRFTPRRTDYAFRGGRRVFEQYLGTAHTIGNRFDDNRTAPAALTPAADAAEIVEETQKRTSAATSPYLHETLRGLFVALYAHPWPPLREA
jgi:hypothetical protein